jgi:hypothetical protein
MEQRRSTLETTQMHRVMNRVKDRAMNRVKDRAMNKVETQKMRSR